MSEEKNECRICFDIGTANDPLITPCDCKGTSAYIHKSCLNNWRQFNIGAPAWERCMECRGKYTFYSKYPTEKFFYNELSKLPLLYFAESVAGFSGTLLIWCIESNNNYLAIRMLNLGQNEKYSYIIKDIREDPYLPQMFYYGYSFFLQSIFFHIYFLYNLLYHVKRKNIFFKKIKPVLYSSICFSLNFIFCYYWLMWNNLQIIFYNFTVFLTFITPYFHYKLMKSHNKILRNLNRDNEEEILSFNHNPLNEHKMTELVNVIID